MKIGVYIGRFQPFHNGHLHVVRKALEQVDHLMVLIGSSDEPRTVLNPWSANERADMIAGALTDTELDRVDILQIQDFPYDNPAWVRAVSETVLDHAEEIAGFQGYEIRLVGHRKDATSAYLSLFPFWKLIEIENFGRISATPLREKFFTTQETLDQQSVPKAVVDWAERWNADWSAEIGLLREEFAAARDYRKQFAGLPYPPTFVTTDAVVIQNGCVLLIERGRFPGKGLLALPGGFLEPHLSLLDNALAELSQETNIGAGDNLLRAGFVRAQAFDGVHRSARGRTITHAHLFRTPDEPSPRGLRPVTAADDAAEAQWVPLYQVQREEMFEDHFAIIKIMTSGIHL